VHIKCYQSKWWLIQFNITCIIGNLRVVGGGFVVSASGAETNSRERLIIKTFHFSRICVVYLTIIATYLKENVSITDCIKIFNEV